MKRPRVSVIMNCLNCAHDLPMALESVRRQTFGDYEIIFWDNASSDASAEIAKSFGDKLHYFRSAAVVPLGQARNLAIAQAKGEYIAFLDCDDLWEPEKLERQVALLDKNSKVGLACTDTEIFNGQTRLGEVFKNAQPARGQAFEELMSRQWISMSSAILRKTALDSIRDENGDWFDPELNVCEEADVFYRIAHDWELDYVPEPLTRWRVHGGNSTFNKFGLFAKETRAILEKHRSLYPGYDTEHGEIVELLLKRAAFQEGVDLWRRGQNKRARAVIKPYLKGCMKHRLFWLAAWLPGRLFFMFSRLYFALPGFLRR